MADTLHSQPGHAAAWVSVFGSDPRGTYYYYYLLHASLLQRRALARLLSTSYALRRGRRLSGGRIVPMGHRVVVDDEAPAAAGGWLAELPMRRHHEQAASHSSVYTEGQLQAFRVTSVTIASLSVAATMLTTFWFLRMRRSFRHDLIILLIQSDMLKSLWFVIFAAAELARGTVDTATPFCQISGFFLTLGIEACDVAVLLVALHKTMYIFRGGSGLFPYRRVAYSVFILVPLLLSSLAFINKPAFVNEGAYCYLPTRPRWTRRMLSWIPRSVILIAICGMYVSTYLYFKLTLGRFGKTGLFGRRTVVPVEEAEAPLRPRTAASIPPTPPIAYHGLIPPTPSYDTELIPNKDRRPSVWTLAEFPPLESARYRVGGVNPADQRPVVLESLFPTVYGRLGATSVEGQLIHTGPAASHELTARDTHQSNGAAIVGAPARKDGDERLPSVLAVQRDADAQHQLAGADSTTDMVAAPMTLGVPSTAQARDKIRRSLRQLFIYPAVYTAVWLVPYVSHITGADRRRAPFGLVMAAVTSLCLQGLVDAVVFCVMEKPWRHPRRPDAPASSCWILRRLAGSPGSYSPEGKTAVKVGRTREEMLVDSRIARRRRDEELAERRLQRGAARPARREWWDTPLRDCQCGRAE
ncbi:GPR1-like protein [Purpureocillium lavendulum]|uniref:GPR1-like protein n=1 Tax=Purpureocillium lavendulum TaxID=1247861 RepID=A0AB34G1T4_9HYPO|nr:GPR1-like protein [Purpureocillium lavendulum]